jgi:hypothetical protein
VTLVLTIVRPGEGAWMCSDRRLSDSRTHQPLPGEADKIVGFRCADGSLLIGIAGLGEIDPRVRVISEWMTETARGANRTVEHTIGHLAQRLNRDVFPAWRRHMLAVGGVAFAITQDWSTTTVPSLGATSLYRVTNAVLSPDGTPSVQRAFEAQKLEVRTPVFALLGGGVALVTASDRKRIQRIAVRRPNKPDDYLGLLAKLIRTVSERDAEQRYGVSPWSRGCYMPATDEPFTFKDFRSHTDPRSANVSVPPQTFRGLDISHMMREFSHAANDLWEGRITTDEFEARTEQAARRSVEGRP